MEVNNEVNMLKRDRTGSKSGWSRNATNASRSHHKVTNQKKPTP